MDLDKEIGSISNNENTVEEIRNAREELEKEEINMDEINNL